MLFLFATVTFLTGDVLIQGYFSVPAGVAEAGQLTAGVSFQVITAFAGAGIGVAMLPVLGRFSRWHGTGYLAAVFELVLPILLIAKGFRRPQSSIAPSDPDGKVFVTA